MSMLASATAAATGWPAKVKPWANESLPSHERLGDLVGGDHRAHRDVGRGQRLGRGDDVRLVAEALAAEVVAEAAPGADHLVGDQQHVVLVADLADPLEVAVRRDEAAAGVLDRLEDHRGDGLRALEQDPLLDRVGRPERVAVVGPAVDVRVRHVAAARSERLELRAQVGDAGRGERSQRGAVVGDLAGDQLGLLAVAAHAVVVAGQLEGRLDRLGAAVGEEDPVEVAGGQRSDLRRELDRPGMGVAPDHEEVELLVPGGRPPRRARCGRGRRSRRRARRDRRGSGCRGRPRRRQPSPLVMIGISVLVVVPAHAGEVHPEVLAGRAPGDRVSVPAWLGVTVDTRIPPSSVRRLRPAGDTGGSSSTLDSDQRSRQADETYKGRDLVAGLS